MKYPQFWLNASPKQKRIYSTFFILFIAIIATLSGTLIQVSPQDQKVTYDQLNQTQTSPTLALDIFVNNFTLCLLMFIPLLGLGVGLFILVQTGMAFRAVFDYQTANGLASSASAANVSMSTALLLLVITGAVFVLEYASYTVAMTESVWLFRRVFQQKRYSEVKITLAVIGLTALLLTIGAIIESYAIQLPL
jgi:hypothetical protein